MHQAFYQQGLAKMSEGDLAGAIEFFGQAIETNPNFAEAYYQRGLAQFKLGNEQASVTDYTRALLSDADNSKIYYARGLAHLAIGKIESAIADAKQAILLNPNDAEAYRVLAAARRKQGATQKAMMSYQKAAELYLDQADVTNCRDCLKQLRLLQGDSISNPAPSPTVASSSSSTSPEAFSSEAFIHQAAAKAKRRNHQAALEDLNWVLQLDPNDAQAYLHRGQILAELKDWRGAMADYHQAAQLFLDRADKANAQVMLDKIQQLKVAQAQAIQTIRQPIRHAISFSSRSVPSEKLSPELQLKLRSLVGDDRRIVVGLVNRLRLKHPGMPENWYWGKAIYDLERDRR
jgi:tetratricopeptide (TPR) repeat protein